MHHHPIEAESQLGCLPGEGGPAQGATSRPDEVDVEVSSTSPEKRGLMTDNRYTQHTEQLVASALVKSCPAYPDVCLSLLGTCCINFAIVMSSIEAAGNCHQVELTVVKCLHAGMTHPT